jgi:predicted transcriptional regulator
MSEEAAAWDQPTPTGQSRPVIEAYAAELAGRLGFTPGWAMRPVLERLGGRLEYECLHREMGESGSIFVYGPRDFKVILPQHTSPSRDQFTMAHEIGHYLLHSRAGEKRIWMRRAGTGRLEWEANWFAGSFLMPEEEFRASAADADWDPLSLAVRFNVSVDAANVRVRYLRGG